MTVDEASRAATDELRDAGIAEPQRDAVSLLAFVLDRDRTFLISHGDYQLSADETERFRSAIDRRASHEPLQYITGRQEFWGLNFHVSPDVLIPRPETEILVEEAIRLLGSTAEPRFCDVGVGSGSIAVSILHSLPSATAVATDISPAALEVARANADRLGVHDRLDLIEADTLDGVTGNFDLLVSNPPYVPDEQIRSLQAEVRDHEPFAALSGGASGLDTIEKLIERGPSVLKRGGWLLMEVGFDQSERVGKLMRSESWRNVDFLPDLQGIPRILRASVA